MRLRNVVRNFAATIDRSGAMITKRSAFSKIGWNYYNKTCDATKPPYEHFKAGFYAGWLARTTLEKAERRKTVRRKPPVQQPQVDITAYTYYGDLSKRRYDLSERESGDWQGRP